jgi:hypothetical protein
MPDKLTEKIEKVVKPAPDTDVSKRTHDPKPPNEKPRVLPPPPPPGGKK